MKGVFLIFLFITLSSTLVACQQVKDSDVVFSNDGEISNLDKLGEFIEKVENGEENKVRIVRYTTEGDPIFHTLDYNGENIKYIYDDSQDEYAGSNKEVKSTTCADLESKENKNKVEYHLTDCSSGFGNHFDFQLPK
ncbi:hypothetical protein CFK37_19440 [Virgibacillus phasianinus]|uniref:DUF4362 domain-containing protein n=1 Tax=Virgibacillus phasianinus TaxID=2017483 RepID=A0A220U7S1_9BACI|nr:DUF4362 domain-containing protein [Virgibacillus phasianinus]ASK64167.1 hypothetical protein CFK37_19440 [Virgibacillus phasianinus]